eukprot:SAG31_NODE_4211_length_3468_cov_25.898783_3_plen_84_part_00
MPAARWVREILPELKKNGTHPIELVQRSGEVVFVPAQWAHAVLNVADVVGVSTQLILTPKQHVDQIQALASTLREVVSKKRGS